MSAPTHDCPGGCGAQVTQHQLACKPCWFRLPKPIRDNVTIAFRVAGTRPHPHRRAVSVALMWYRDNKDGA